jgi:hypothetical protein
LKQLFGNNELIESSIADAEFIGFENNENNLTHDNFINNNGNNYINNDKFSIINDKINISVNENYTVANNEINTNF